MDDLFSSQEVQGVSVLKRLTEESLEEGVVSVGEKERESLGLPIHSDSDIVFLDPEGQPIRAEWNGRRRTLGGETLGEHLQMYGRIGWYLRMENRGGTLRLTVVSSPARLKVPEARTLPTKDSAKKESRKKREQRRLREERFRVRQHDEFEWRNGVGVHRPTLQRFSQQLEKGGWDPAELVALRLRGERLAAVNNFEELLALEFAKIDHMPHQEATAIRVLSEMNGRAVLADEVGLGKTIEAALVLKELVLRGLARRILVICPATLREQWRDELKEKFDEPDFEVVDSGAGNFAGDRLIMSLQLARANREVVASEPWDLVVVDEAHRVAGRQATMTRALITDLDTRYLLFLTATPVQNDLLELFRLVQLLRPGTFPSEAAFKRRFSDTRDPRMPVRTDELRKLVRDVMIRTTRAQAGLDRVTRYPVDRPVELNPFEREFYDVVLRLLRTDQGDHFRRRQLAQRIAVSPRSAMKMAMRMAESHPDPRVQERLKSLAHELGDMGPGTRELIALDQIQAWRKEHGRVLVFAQHTDTVSALLGHLEEAGIDALPFHGGLSGRAKSDAINGFTRERDFTPVLVSTDAGAEGLNLQAANCVLNFDLPWNPMRIEQRIGRVHRVTQHRDVFVANLFVKDTIDESVYWLLREKLAMFELLFGQVTTVLGEMDGRGGAKSFDGRVLEAMLEPDGSTMQARIDRLGADLESARASAKQMMAAGTHLDRWAVAAESDRKRRASFESGGNRDLAPELVERQRERQAEVGVFARDFLTAIGATTVLDQGGLLSARVPEEWVEELGGRDELHLALTHRAVEDHPDAELCAVGTEIFEEMLWALRLRGDLAGWIVQRPVVSQEPGIEHTRDVRFVERWVTGPEEWHARSTWRVSASTGGDEVVDIDIGDVGEPPRRSVPLSEGELLPETVGVPVVVSAVSDAVQEGLVGALETRRREAKHGLDQEWVRGEEYYESQIAERETELRRTRDVERTDQLKEDLRQLRQALSAHQDQHDVGVDVELQTELLAIDFRGGSSFTVHESWEYGDDKQVEVSYPWKQRARHTHASGEGDAIDVLAICDTGHLLDEAHRRTCPSCSRTTCQACGENDRYDDCEICGTQRCGHCRAIDPLLCGTCVAPTRVPEFDDEYRKAWRLGADVLLKVGHAAAELHNGEDVITIVPDAEVVDTFAKRARSFLRRLDFPVDSGLGASAIPAVDVASDAVFAEQVPQCSWDLADEPGVDRDERLVSYLETVDEAEHVVGEISSGTAPVLRLLRDREPPPMPPALLGSLSIAVREFRVDDLGIHERSWTALPAGSGPDGESCSTAPFEPSQTNVAEARLEPVSAVVRRVHRSALVEVRSPDATVRWFVAGADGATYGGELAWQRVLRDRELPSDAIVSLANPRREPSQDDFAHPEKAELLGRTIEATSSLVPTPSIGLPPLDELLPTLDATPLDDPSLPAPAELAAGVREILAARIEADEIPAYLLNVQSVVHETWEGHGRATVSYVMPPAGGIYPPLADTGEPADNFGVDSRGHLHRAGGSDQCPVCQRWGCGACGSIGAVTSCEGCDRPACGECRTSDHTTYEPESCVRCDNSSCPTCGRQPNVKLCPVCRRDVCSECRTGDVCSTCASLQEARPASPEVVSSLPATLGARGLGVRVAEDGDATVVSIAGRTRSEIVVLRDGDVVRWVDLTTGDTRHRDLRIALAAAFPIDGDVQLVIGATPSWPGPPPSSLAVKNGHHEELRWTLTDSRGRTVAGTDAAAGRAAGLPDEAAIDRLIAARGLEPVRIPERGHGHAVAVASPGGFSGERGTLQIEVHREVDQVWLDGDGVHVISGDLRNPSRTDGRWNSGRADWATGEFDPAPEVVAIAQAPGHAAALLRFGEVLVLGTAVAGDQNWAPVAGGVQQLEEFQLGAALGLSEPVRVAACTNPQRIEHLKISGASLVAEPTVVPAVVVGVEGRPARSLTLQALASWGAGRELDANLLDGTLPDVLVAELERVAHDHGSSARVRTIGIGASVLERWLVGADEVEIRYELSPGEHQGRAVCAATGKLSPSLLADRSGHLVASGDTCTYCRSVTCGNCDRPVAPCSLCSVGICGSCARLGPHPGHFCPACAVLSPVSERESRRMNLGIPKRKPLIGKKRLVLVGEDPIHRLVFTYEDSTWTGRELFSDGREVRGEVRSGSETDRALCRLAGIDEPPSWSV